MLECDRFFRDKKTICQSLLLPSMLAYNKSILSEQGYKSIVGLFSKKQTNQYKDISKNSLVAYSLQQTKKLDIRINDLRKSYNRQTFCQTACNDCCSDYFYISQTEYYILRYAMLQNSSLAALINLGQEQMQLLKTKHPNEFNKLMSISDCNTAFTSNQEYMQQFMLCPLNDSQSGLCRLYENRPITCRIYGNNAERGCCSIMRDDFILANGSVNATKVKTYLIDEWLCEEICGVYFDYFPLMKEGQPVIKENSVVPCFTRPMPLIYWLTHDEQYAKKYQDAVSLHILEYNIKYFSID